MKGWNKEHEDQFSSVTQSYPTLQPHESQYARLSCPSPTPGVHSDSRLSSQWCHPAISSSVVPFSSRLQSFPASGSFQMSQLFAWGGQSIGVSASTSVLPMNTQDWSPLGWTAWISLQSKGLSRVFSNTTVQNHRMYFKNERSPYPLPMGRDRRPRTEMSKSSDRERSIVSFSLLSQHTPTPTESFFPMTKANK